MKQGFRTDLALENRAALGAEFDALPGVTYRSGMHEGIRVHRMVIETAEAADRLCKPIGTYDTLEMSAYLRRQDRGFSQTAQALAEILREQLRLRENDSVLLACLGNPGITPDAIGPICAKNILVTRHLKQQLTEVFDSFRGVSVVCPGVLGTTGIESAALVKAAAETVRPDRVIAVDALAARSLHRLCRTVQICNSGIAPGSGVGNHRQALNQEALGIPVIAVGVPTVVDAGTMAAELTNQDEPDGGEAAGMIVTPREIDRFVADAGKLVGYGINLALHPALSLADLEGFLS